MTWLATASNFILPFETMSMKLPLPRLPGALTRYFRETSLDLASIEQKINEALSTAKIDRSTGPLKVVADTLRRTPTPTAPMTGDGASRRARADADAVPVPAGQVISGTHTGAAGTRHYKLFVPQTATGSPPLVVMLHGCTQSPDDFAAGTRMNEIAAREGFLVVYPAQSANANGSKCWNWFKPQDQAREGGEPSLVAGIVRDVAAIHGVDPKRIFVAGLSAGGAMAVILGRTHPELFRAVGVHSGLPYGAAHDMASAFSAMGRGAEPDNATRGAFVPTIVFHGDRDTTVHAGNGDAVVAQAVRGLTSADHRAGGIRPEVTEGATPSGSRYTRTVHADAGGRPRVEHWVVHGAGHAWAGGSRDGSYTAPDGPDASEAMVRFFKAQDRAAGHAGG